MFCFDLLRFTPPEDGLPVTDDWCTTFESMLFGGVELGREPLDVSLKFPPGLGLLKPLCFKRFNSLWLNSLDSHCPCRPILAYGMSLHGPSQRLDQVKRDHDHFGRGFRTRFVRWESWRAAASAVPSPRPLLDGAGSCNQPQIQSMGFGHALGKPLLGPKQ